MSELLILTQGGWKTVDRLQRGITTVYNVQHDRTVCLAPIHHIEYYYNTTCYKAFNRYDNQTMYYNDQSILRYRFKNGLSYVHSKSDMVNTVSLHNDIVMLDRPIFSNDNCIQSPSDTELRNYINQRIIPTTLLQCSTDVAAQTLYLWREKYKKLSATDWNQALMLQALAIKTSLCSNIIRTNTGLTVERCPRDDFDITDIITIKDNAIPWHVLDSNHKHIHAIYNYNGSVFVL